MNPDKIKAAVQWPALGSRRELQRFLGFSNFYRRFTQGYSAIVAPVIALTSSKTPFDLSSVAEKVFLELKRRFTIVLNSPSPFSSCGSSLR